MAYMLGEPLRGEAIRYQVGNRSPALIVDQNVVAVLLVYTAGERRTLSRFLPGRFLFLLRIGLNNSPSPFG